MKTYTAYFNWFTIELPLDAVIDCSHQGDCAEDVEYWTPRINIDASPEQIRAELKEYGAWDADELADDEANRQRIVWFAACDLHESLKASLSLGYE